MKAPQQWHSLMCARLSRDGMTDDEMVKMIARIQRDAIRGVQRQAETMRDWCVAWLIRARMTLYREGWEEGMSDSEMLEDLTNVLANLGCDEGTGAPEQVAEHARLVALPITCSPPRLGRR